MDHGLLLALLAIVGAVGLGAISPGPSFVVVARIALSSGPGRGRASALGVGTGGLILATIAVAGLGAVLLWAEWLFVALKVAGGAYLLYLGIRLWIGSFQRHANPDAGAAVPPGRAYATGLVTQLSNPKAIVVYGSVYASALPTHAPLWLLVAAPAATTLVEAVWYLVVATIMSRGRMRAAYARGTAVLDRIAGTVVGGLGVYFAVDGVRTALR